MKKVLLSLLCAIFLLQGCSKQNEGEPIELTAQEVLVRLQDPKKIPSCCTSPQKIAIPVMNMKK